MKVSILKTLSVIALLSTAVPAKADDNTVVAIVNGHKITLSEVMAAKDALPKQYKSIPEDKLYPVLLNQAVDAYLINKAADASGEAQKEDVKKAIEKATQDIVSQAFLFSKVKDAVSDQAVEAKYQEVVKNFPEEKEVHLRHILVDDEKTAKGVIKALKAGTDFKKLAASKSKDSTAKEGGDLGFFRKSELPQELAAAAFALKDGSYSQEPVKTDFGWHVLKVESFRDAKPPKFDEIKNELKALMTQEAIVAIVKDLRTNAKVELFDKDGKPMPKDQAPKADAQGDAKDDASSKPADDAAATDSTNDKGAADKPSQE